MDLDSIYQETQPLFNEPVMTLATVSPKYEPHAAAVYFAVRWPAQPTNEQERTDKPAEEGSLALYFFSDPNSRHSRDLLVNPNVGGEIHPPGDDWRAIHGLQFNGIVEQVPKGQSWTEGWDLYAEKFPFVIKLRSIVARNEFYRIQILWLRLIDNQRRFGYKTEWCFG